METIYLIQPLEFINTNTYKIGRSSKNDLSRCKNGYRKLSILSQYGLELICFGIDVLY